MPQLFLAVLLDNFSNWEEEEAAAREAMLADLRRKKDVAKAKAELAMEQKRVGGAVVGVSCCCAIYITCPRSVSLVGRGGTPKGCKRGQGEVRS